MHEFSNGLGQGLRLCFPADNLEIEVQNSAELKVFLEKKGKCFGAKMVWVMLDCKIVVFYVSACRH